MVFTLAPSMGVAYADEPPSSPIDGYTLTVDYDMTLTSTGDQLEDKAGDFDAPLTGLTASNITTDEEGHNILTFPATPAADRYAAIPDGVVTGEQFAIEATFSTDRTANYQLLWGLGTRRAATGTTTANMAKAWSNLTNYLNLMPNSGSVMSVGIKDTSLAGLKVVTSSAVSADTFTTVLVVFDKGVVKTYRDGELIGTIDSGYSIQDILSNGVQNRSAAIGWIGRTMFASGTPITNNNFRGKLKSFKIYNKPQTDQQVLDDACDGLAIPDANAIRGNVTLPTETKSGVAIAWASSDESIVSTATVTNANYDDTPPGVVTRPQDGDAQVTLTATLSYKGLQATKTIDLTVKKAPAPVTDADHYLFTHFTGAEGTAASEQVYFATSKDGLNFSDLNNLDPVLTSDIGEKGVRDMCMIRSAEGDRFFLIATDLSIYYRGGWNTQGNATNTGSRKVVVWESTDLVNWSEPRLVPVAPDGAGNAWAPEAFYDEKTGEYLIFYASVTSQNEIWVNKTRDFYTFTPAEKFVSNIGGNTLQYSSGTGWTPRNPPANATSTIDASIMEHDGYYYRSERINENNNCYQRVDRVSKADGLLSDQWDITSLGSMESAPNINRAQGGLEGPEFYKLGSSAGEHAGKWVIMADQFAAGTGYLPILMADPADPATWTAFSSSEYNFGFAKKRHGNILPITEAEYKAVTEKYGMIDVDAPAPEAFDVIADFNFNEAATDGVYNGGKAIATVSGSVSIADKGAAAVDENDKAASFNGASGNWLSLTKSDGTSLLAGLEEFTVSYDAKAARTSTNWPFYAAPNANTQAGGSETYLGLFESGGNTTAERFRGGRESGAMAATGTNWVHVEVVYKKASTSIYINGALKGYAKSSFPIPSILGNNPIAQIGKANWGSGEWYSGLIDNFKIYINKKELPAKSDLIADYSFAARPDDGANVPNLAEGSAFGPAVVQNPNATTTTWANGAINLNSTNTSNAPTGSWVLLPNDILKDLNSATISIEFNPHSQMLSRNHFLWNIGSTSTTSYWFANARTPRSSITTGGSGAEKTAGAPKALESSFWNNITAVLDGDADTLTFYLNGVKTGSVAAGGLTPNSIATQTRNALGRSPYTGDYLFRGSIANFHVYGRALTAAEVSEVAASDGQPNEAMFLANAQSIADTASDLTITEETTALPALGGGVVYKSNDARIAIGSDGVTATTQLPAPGTADFEATLTATATVRGQSASKNITVTVLAPLTDEERVDIDLEALAIENADSMREDFSVPTKGVSDTNIAWVVKEAGAAGAALADGVNSKSKTVNITRPAYGSDDATLVLEATVSRGEITKTKEFTVTVKAMPQPNQKTEAYAMAFFIGESDTGERIWTAASKGNNALKWDVLNDGNPVVTSQYGEKGLRDPFIMRSKDGDKFYMLATDLMSAGGDFNRAQRRGSTYIEIWESTDLVNWSAQRHTKVNTDYAGNTWAPEAYYDEANDVYMVYWASNLYPTTNNMDRTGLTYNRMMYVTTKDFINFSEPQIWIDVPRGSGTNGSGCIDVTIQKVGDWYYRVYKDESNMRPRMERSKNLYATVVGTTLPTATGSENEWTLVKDQICVGLNNGYGGTLSAGEGPCLFVANDGDESGYKYYLWVDQPNYHGGPNHYIPFASNDITDGNSWLSMGGSNFVMPVTSTNGRPRHGTVVPVTKAEHSALLAALGPDVAATGVALNKEALTITTGKTATLTATVSPEEATNKNVMWESSDLSVATVDADGVVTANSAGTATITATTEDGGFTATCAVTVADPVDSDKSMLQFFIEYAEDELASDHNYIPASVANLEAALEDAKAVFDDDQVTQAEVDAATWDLFTAISQLYDKGDKTGLQSLIDMMEQLSEDDYTPNSWADFQDALDAAKAVLNNDNAIQDRVNKAIDDLNAAFGELVRVADFRSLASAVTLANRIIANLDDYIASTVIGLEDQITLAQAVLSDRNSTQAEVDAVRNALNKLIAKARLKPDKSPILNALAEARSLNMSLYTSASAKSLNALMVKADALLAAPEEKVTQSEINALATEIKGAIKDLEPKQGASVPAANDDKAAVSGGTAVNVGKESTVSDKLDKAEQGNAKPATAASGTQTAPSTGTASQPKAASQAQATGQPAAATPNDAAAIAGIPAPAVADAGGDIVASGEIGGADIAVIDAGAEAPAAGGSEKNNDTAYWLIIALFAAAICGLLAYRFGIRKNRKMQQ
jgi:hypothetical protein